MSINYPDHPKVNSCYDGKIIFMNDPNEKLEPQFLEFCEKRNIGIVKALAYPMAYRLERKDGGKLDNLVHIFELFSL